MGYDANGKWINPKSVGFHKKITSRQLLERKGSMTREQQNLLIATIRTGQQLSPLGEALRWFLLEGIVRSSYIKRWKFRPYLSSQWYNTSYAQYGKPLYYYDLTERVMDLWDIIKNAPSKGTALDTTVYAIKNYFYRAGDLETIHQLKGKYGISFTTGDPKRNYIEREIIPNEALQIERYVWWCGYDFATTYRAMIHTLAKKYDAWLRGETHTSNPRLLVPSAAKMVNLYASLWKHFILIELGEAVHYDSFYQFDTDTQYVPAMRNVFTPFTGDYITYYLKLRKVGNLLQRRARGTQLDALDVQQVMKDVYSTRFILPSAIRKPNKSTYKPDRKFRRTD